MFSHNGHAGPINIDVKLLLSLLLLLPTIVLAQDPVVVEKQVVCNWVSVVLDSLKNTHKEEPIWLGNDRDRTRYSVFVNPKNGHFTIIQFNNEIACVLGGGNSSTNLPIKPTL